MMIAWGTLSTCLLFVTTPTEFYTLRLFTGAAEAGFFPGVVLYLSRWFPTAAVGGSWPCSCRRSRCRACSAARSPAGSQPLRRRPGRPGRLAVDVPDARHADRDPGRPGLFPAQRRLRQRQVAEPARARGEADQADDLANKPKTTGDSLLAVFKNPAIIWLIYFCIQSGVYAINFWLPSIIKNLGFDNLVIGWLSAIPYLLAAVFMMLVGRSADLRNERRWHLVVPMLMGALGLLIAVNFAQRRPSRSRPDPRDHGRADRPADVLASADRAVQRGRGGRGLALINSMGQMAGFLSPYLVGWVKDSTGSTDAALYLLAGVIVGGSLLALRMTRTLRRNYACRSKDRSLRQLLQENTYFRARSCRGRSFLY
jgi:MFS family permease